MRSLPVMTLLLALGATERAALADEAAPASQPGNQGAAVLDVVVVTAQKREEQLLDVPESVSVVSADLIQQVHAERFDDFFTRVPSAAISETQAGQTRLILRGINTGGVGATVATYVDETPYGSATSIVNGAILTPDLDPGDISRVEVLRGPQGTLYGANSLGGLVKFVTISPTVDAIHGYVSGSGENIDGGSTGYSGRGAVNLPLGNSAAVRVSGFYRRDPGFIDDPRFGRNINDGKTYGGRVSALFMPTDALTLRASVTLQDLDSNGSNAEDVDPITLQPVLGKRVQSRIVATPSNMQYRIYNLIGTYDFGAVSLVSSTSLSNLNQAATQDDSGVYTPALEPVFGLVGYSQDQRVHQQRFTQETRLSSAKSDRFEWTLGGYYTREHNFLDQAVDGVDYATGLPLDALSDLFTGRESSQYHELAAFANATVKFTSRFDVTLGGRYSHNKQSLVTFGEGPLAGGILDYDDKSSEGVFTYSAAPSYKPTENVNLYARIAKGYRPGGPNSLPPLAPDSVPREFGSDTTTNFEVGIKSDLLEHRLSVELTAFWVNWNHIQLFTSVDDFGINANGGQARSKGVEFSFTAKPIPELQIGLNGAYTDAYLTEDTPALVGGLRGDHLPFTAKFASTLFADYTRPINAQITGIAGLSWRYTGNRESDFDTAYGQRDLDAFSQLDAHAGITFGQFRIDAFGRNLTDSRGILNVGSAGSALNGSVAAAIVRPRSYGVSLEYRF